MKTGITIILLLSLILSAILTTIAFAIDVTGADIEEDYVDDVHIEEDIGDAVDEEHSDENIDPEHEIDLEGDADEDYVDSDNDIDAESNNDEGHVNSDNDIDVNNGIEIMPFAISGFEDYVVVNLLDPTRDNLSNALGGVNSSRNIIIIIERDATWSRGVEITGNRHVIIASKGTNLNDFSFPEADTPYRISFTSGTGVERFFWVSGSATLTLSNITFDGNTTSNDPQRGGINVGDSGTLILENGSLITRSSSQRNTGMGGSVDSGVGGGGVRVNGGTLRMEKGSMISNNRGIFGGGIRVTGGTAIISGGTISGNTGTAFGGGIQVEGTGSSLIMYEGHVHSNNGGNRGGGIRVIRGATFTMYNGVIEGNSVAGDPAAGGGVIVGELHQTSGVAPVFTMHGGTIQNNYALRGGGVGVVDGGIFNMHEGDIRNNRNRSSAANAAAIEEGGGVWLGRTLGGNSIAEFTMIGGTIDDNRAIAGAGVRLNGGGTFEMRNGTISRNTATTSVGGGLDANGGTFTMHGGKINNNDAGGSGGGIHMRPNSTLTMNNGEVSGNTSRVHGGGIASDQARITINDGKIHNNTAMGNGGGIAVWGPNNGNTNRQFNINGGIISNNLANNGGGLFVDVGNRVHINIQPESEFTGNIARHGLLIDNAAALQHSQRIRPNRVSLTGTTIIAEMPSSPGDYELIEPHAFTNYDINTTGTRFWLVTYIAEQPKDGDIEAKVGRNNVEVPSGAFVQDRATVMFNPDPSERFIDWEIQTSIANPDDSAIEYPFNRRDDSETLQQLIATHTHVIGNFQPTQESTTTLTVSKTVTGEFGNLTQNFEFTVLLTDADGNAFDEGTELNYIGGTIDGFNSVVPQDGTLKAESDGTLIFELKHGQSITIEGVPSDGYVQVVETPTQGYIVSFIDSENTSIIVDRSDTTLLPMTADRAFSFTNERFIPPAMGLNLGDNGPMLLLSALTLLIGVTVFVIRRRVRLHMN